MTMPAAVPGSGSMADLMSAPMGGGAPPQQASPAIGGGLPGMPGTPNPDQYATTTQQDGSILLHLKLPDGSLGPVVKIIEPIKPRKPAAQPGMV